MVGRLRYLNVMARTITLKDDSGMPPNTAEVLSQTLPNQFPMLFAYKFCRSHGWSLQNKVSQGNLSREFPKLTFQTEIRGLRITVTEKIEKAANYNFQFQAAT